MQRTESEEVLAPVCPPRPHEDQLERFVRGELPPDEARDIVRHLLTGCAECLRVTRRVWSLGDEPLQKREGWE